MSVIKIPILFAGTPNEQTGTWNEKTLYTLFDSGANLSCINPDMIEDLAVATPLGKVRRLETASEGHYVEITDRVTLDFYIDDLLLSDEFLVVPGLSEDAIIGAATLQKWRIKLDFEHDKVIVDPRVAKHQLKKLALAC
jgi:hypothetical protein